MFKKIILFSISAILFSSCTKDDKKENTESWETAYNDANFEKGGIMYDRFWSDEAEIALGQDEKDMLQSSADFFRCKQCHGWDALGSEGSYINRAPKASSADKAGRPAVSSKNIYMAVQDMSPKELFDSLKKEEGRRSKDTDLTTYDPSSNAEEGEKMPILSELLTDAEIWDFVKFFKEGIYNVEDIYEATYTGTYPTGSFAFTNHGLDGDNKIGEAIYKANCVGCHGDDGLSMIGDDSVGRITREKAYEVQHKVKYGVLGTHMRGEFDITLDEMKGLYKYMADETNLPNRN